MTLYAEDTHYWQTSSSSADTWIERAQREIVTVGGRVTAEAFGSEPGTGRAAYILAFEIGGNRYRLVWPVLPSRKGLAKAARVQAATFLYHDVKARCMSAVVLGTRAAFLPFLLLPDGRTASDATGHELAALTPAMFGGGQPLLPGGKDAR